MANKAESSTALIPVRIEPPASLVEFDVDRVGWKTLTEVIWPAAKNQATVLTALAYCKSRGLDPMKGPVHIVDIWDFDKCGYVETIWSGIGELRITAMRTGQYAGKDETKFGPNETDEFEWQDKTKKIVKQSITYPEWAQITVHRETPTHRTVTFVGPRVYWRETMATIKGGAPNSMWRKRPFGQLEKCAEAAALRVAFPEEIGTQYIQDEVDPHRWDGDLPVISGDAPQPNKPPLEEALVTEPEDVPDEPSPADGVSRKTIHDAITGMQDDAGKLAAFGKDLDTAGLSEQDTIEMKSLCRGHWRIATATQDQPKGEFVTVVENLIREVEKPEFLGDLAFAIGERKELGRRKGAKEKLIQLCSDCVAALGKAAEQGP